MQPNSPPEPAAPAAPIPTEPAPAAPAAPDPAAPAEPVTPAPRTQDPVDHSAPTPPVDPATPPVDPAAPAPDDPATPPDPAAPAEPDAAALASDVEDDDLNTQIEAAKAASPDGALPSGVNPDGTIDPLIYAYENMPDIVVQGKEGAKGEIKQYTIKTADDLPDDFRFANDKERMSFAGKLQENMNAANTLINEANTHNEARIQQNERRELLSTQKNELDQLIASGKLPAIAAKPTDENFMQDPGAVRAQQVLDHMKAMNEEFKASGSNQVVTSVALALRDLEASEAIAARDGRMGTITDTRNSVNAKINGGNQPAQPSANANAQTVHKDVQSALRAARRKHGI